MNIEINGAKILFEIPILGGIQISESMVNALMVSVVLMGLCIFLTKGMMVKGTGMRQVIAEFLVKTAQSFVHGNMGPKFAYYGPFIAAMFSLSLCSSLLSLLGLYPPTSNLSTTLGWAVLVFVLITYTKIRTGGVKGYALGFTKPIFILTPFNILSELATPISMGFRHFGNIISGTVITALLYAALAAASSALFGLLPGVIGDVASQIPLLQVGVPAVFSVYFDLFSSAMQAFIFCMLTTLYIANAAAED